MSASSPPLAPAERTLRGISRFLTIVEAAGPLHVHRRTIARAIRRHDLVAYRAGRRVLVTRKSLAAWLRST